MSLRPRHAPLLLLPMAVLGCLEQGPDASLDSRRLSVGEATACALDRDGGVFCWGRNAQYLEYGVSPGDVPPSSTPVAVPIPRLTALGGGVSQHMCGLLPTGGAVCWGRGGRGQMGNGAAGFTGNPPTSVQSNAEWTSIGVGRLTACAVATTGEGFCWGLNQLGELGDSSLVYGEAQTAPNKVSGGITFASVVPGWLHTCGISTAGALYCWGSNSSGQLGIGSSDSDPHPRPLLVPFAQPVRKVSLSARSTCAITADDRAWCWGYNGVGQLGDGTSNQRLEPTPVGAEVKFTDIAMSSGFADGMQPAITPPSGLAQGGVAHTCAVSTARTVYCWGWNGAGQLGIGTTISQPLPTVVSGASGVGSVALGGAYSCAITDSDLLCWGSNYTGQLGNGTYVDSPVPVRVAFPWSD
ncbi:MAG TPA: hypothetical protein VFO55_07355 [Gemmatimonadaceae bacterium]|nr:hypothetical protein [Gemmatimonadaceae bacterium]